MSAFHARAVKHQSDLPGEKSTARGPWRMAFDPCRGHTGWLRCDIKCLHKSPGCSANPQVSMHCSWHLEQNAAFLSIAGLCHAHLIQAQNSSSF